MDKARAKPGKAKAYSSGDDAWLKEMRDRAALAVEFQRDNAEAAYDDLKFRAGLNQWDAQIRRDREEQGRPCFTENRVPQFVRQVTGDIRQSRPSMKAVAVDDDADLDKAEIISELLRYIEHRSNADAVYFQAVDSQVTCGIGAWRIETELTDPENNIQDLRIAPIDDAVGILWDPDARLPNREDADWCFVPVDMSLAKFKAKYPEASASSFSDMNAYSATLDADAVAYWTNGDKIRVAEYWCKKDGEIRRHLVTATEELEPPKVWPGKKFIPIVPVIGEEVRFGPEVYRHGVVRYLKEPQMRFNAMISAETEVVALQPKAPFMVTPKQIEDVQDLWDRAHQDAVPYLVYNPDPQAPAPQRVTPAVQSSGIIESARAAAEAMHAVTGIYPASLGQRSNETSGVAIRARKAEGDTGTYVYADNFARAVAYCGKILVECIPAIYDTQRTLRVIGEDGAVNEVTINEAGFADGLAAVLNDVTVGTYDVRVEIGPAFSTKREEAKEGMAAFAQAAPQLLPLFADLFAKAQEWPLSDKIAERLREALPPGIREREAQEEGGPDGMPMMPPQPPPEAVMQMQAQQAAMKMDMASKEADVATKQAQAQKAQADAQRAAIEAERAQMELAAMQVGALQPPPAPQVPQELVRALETQAAAISELQQIVVALMQPQAPPEPVMMGDMIDPSPPMGGGLMPDAPPPGGVFISGDGQAPIA